MAANECTVQAPPHVVFDVLCDAPSYVLWVVGSKHIRGVDAEWPQPGAKIHHIVGWGPFEDHDTTEVLEIDPPHRLRLEARAWPFGTAEVAITLTPDGDATHLQITETPLRGPARRFDCWPMERAVALRNRWSVRRLGRWAEERYRGTPRRRA